MQNQDPSEDSQSAPHETDDALRPLDSIKELVNDAIEYLENHYKNKGRTGLATGFEQFDQLTGGLQPGSLNVIASRPSIGKTALAMNIAEHVAVDQKIPVVIFELELGAKMLVLRLLCSRARVNFHSVHHGFLGKGETEKLTAAAADFMQSKLTVDDRGRPTVMEIEKRVKSLMADHRLGLIVIDTFESLGSGRRLAPHQRTEEMSVIAHGLRALARESKVPILVVARLSRDADNRENQMPILPDLSESGSLDQEADLVGLLYRVAYHAEDEKGRAERGGDKAELIIAKNSLGPLGSVPLTFQSEFTRFESRAF